MASETPPPPAAASTTVAAVTDDTLSYILHRLAPADLLLAALACHRWRRAAARCITGAPPPLLGYFFHPADTFPTVPLPRRLRRHLRLHHVRRPPRPRAAPPGVAPLRDPPTHPRPRPGLPPPRAAPAAPARRAAGRPSALPRRRRALARSPEQALLRRRLPHRRRRAPARLGRLLPRRRVQLEGAPAGHRSHGQVRPLLVRGPLRARRGAHLLAHLQLRPPAQARPCHAPLLLPAGAVRELWNNHKKFRIGETPEDGKLCMATVEEQEMEFWVRGEASGSDNGWFLRKRMNMRKVFDTVPWLPRDMVSRVMSIWLSDIDPGRTGKLFIRTMGYGRYSFHMDTGKLVLLATEDGKEYGHPIYAYYMAWPPAFLAAEV